MRSTVLIQIFKVKMTAINKDEPISIKFSSRMF